MKGGLLMLACSNPALDPVPFGHWTLRDEAAQRRSAPRSTPLSRESAWYECAYNKP